MLFTFSEPVLSNNAQSPRKSRPRLRNLATVNKTKTLIAKPEIKTTSSPKKLKIKKIEKRGKPEDEERKEDSKNKKEEEEDKKQEPKENQIKSNTLDITKQPNLADSPHVSVENSAKTISSPTKSRSNKFLKKLSPTKTPSSPTKPPFSPTKPLSNTIKPPTSTNKPPSCLTKPPSSPTKPPTSPTKPPTHPTKNSSSPRKASKSPIKKSPLKPKENASSEPQEGQEVDLDGACSETSESPAKKPFLKSKRKMARKESLFSDDECDYSM